MLFFALLRFVSKRKAQILSKFESSLMNTSSLISPGIQHEVVLLVVPTVFAFRFLIT